MDEVERGFQVDVQYGIPLSLAHAHHQAVFSDAGIVNKDIHPSEIFDDLSDNVVCLLKISGIRGITFSLDTQSFDLCLCSQALLVNHQVCEGDVGTLCGELQGDRLANTTSGARNNGYLSI